MANHAPMFNMWVQRGTMACSQRYVRVGGGGTILRVPMSRM